jgi:hypothetical protein
MPNALTTVRTLRRASAQIGLRQTAMLFVKGTLASHAGALMDWWQWWRSTAHGRCLTHWRSGSSQVWQSITSNERELSWSAMFSAATSDSAPRWLELSDRPDNGCDPSSTSLMIYDLPAVMGLDRASLMCLRLPDSATPASFTQLGEASLKLLPVWWGTAGWAFQYESGRPDVAARRMAALARRYWCAQILDTTSLQWDALLGIPSVNWLTWVGPAFAEQQGTTLDALATAAAVHVNETIFHRLTGNGLSIAAGPKPLKGDINLAEDFNPYTIAAKVLKPLFLNKMTPLAGPFADPIVLNAWLQRFELPQAWLTADISDK